jgi:hypothetical protein
VALIEEAEALQVEGGGRGARVTLELKNGAIALAAASLKVVLRHCFFLDRDEESESRTYGGVS